MSTDALARKATQTCRRIAAFSEEDGHTTRTFLSPPMHGVHALLGEWMRGLGMRVSVDGAGNLRGRHDAATDDGPTLFLGSHLDTVPRAGAFDGILGVVMGIALVDALERRRLPFAVEIVGFSEEEGVRFGAPFIGSLGFCGRLDPALLGRRDARGVSVAEAITAFGLSAEPPSAPVHAFGYVEFHIEQGPVLEARGLPLGIVDAIAGQTRATVRFEGAAGHAGTTPMDNRKDALAAAAEWIVSVEQGAKATAGLVATVGRIGVEPGAGNVIPARCTCALDVRHADDDTRRSAVARALNAATAIAHQRGLSADADVALDQPAVAMDRSFIAGLERAVRASGIEPFRLTSGAGHDAMVVAPLMPAAMLFLRSPGGISHDPAEAVIEADVALGLEVGLRFLDELAAERA